MKKYIFLGVFCIAAALSIMIGLPDVATATSLDFATSLVGPGIALAGLGGMILSANHEFSVSQDLAQVAGTYNSTNIVDTGAPGTVYGAAAALNRNVGPGREVPVLVQVTEAFTSGGAATLQIQIETADDAAFTTNNVVIAQSRVYALAELILGLTWGVQVLPADCQRFLRVNYVIGGATTTAGKCSAFIPFSVQNNSNQ